MYKKRPDSRGLLVFSDLNLENCLFLYNFLLGASLVLGDSFGNGVAITLHMVHPSFGLSPVHLSSFGNIAPSEFSSIVISATLSFSSSVSGTLRSSWSFSESFSGSKRSRLQVLSVSGTSEFGEVDELAVTSGDLTSSFFSQP